MTATSPSPSELPEGVLPCDQTMPDGTVVYSLTAHSLKEMERYRWIRSEEAGEDIGENVTRLAAKILEWLDAQPLLEHLLHMLECL